MNKMKKLFVMALSAAMFFACSKENSGTQEQNNGEKAYLSLQLPKSPTKAPVAENGTAGESKMTKVTVLLFDANDICLGSVDFGTLTDQTASASKEVSAKTAKVFIVVGNVDTKWNLASATVKGFKWADINKFAAITVSEIATDDAFTMTNAGDIINQALKTVTVFKTPAEAIAAPAEINVDRVSSKVTVTSGTPKVPNATFTFTSWELNTVNKTTALYTQKVAYAGASTLNGLLTYRVDNNYNLPIPVGEPAREKFLNDNFIWLSNGTSTATMTPINNAAGAVDYATENTMAAADQLWGLTTKVVIKGKYTPNNDIKGTITAGTSYFELNKNYYSPATMKAEYKTDADIKAKLITFLSKANITFAADVTKADATIDAAIDALDDYSGIKGKYTDLRYYHESVCYYDVLIRHDDAITTLMALGRYGVVRNNFYELDVKNVNGPGTPWIPDPTDPTDPSKPTDPDDEIPANLSVKITVNPWTKWSQGVDLGN